jgi:hypothetical protein
MTVVMWSVTWIQEQALDLVRETFAKCDRGTAAGSRDDTLIVTLVAEPPVEEPHDGCRTAGWSTGTSSAPTAS